MGINEKYPRFKNQNELLWNLIEERTTDFLKRYGDDSISDNIILDQITKEFKYIIKTDTAGLFYIITKAFDEELVDRSEIIAFGTSGGAVIPNLLGLTGVGAEKRMRGIFAKSPKYYPELFYGFNNALLDPNPSNIRMTFDSYCGVMERIAELLGSSENYSKIDPLILIKNRATDMGIYLSYVDDLMVSDFESVTAFKNRCIPSYDADTMDVFYYRYYNQDPDDEEESTSNYKIPYITDEAKYKISEVCPLSLDDISKAISMTLVKKDYIDAGIYFREQVLENCIRDGREDDFMKLKKECIREQIFPRVHIDSIVEACWRIAYYQVHFTDECMKVIDGRN